MNYYHKNEKSFKVEEASIRVLKIVLVPFTTKIVYDGSQIKPLWTFKEMGVIGDSICIFRGGMTVSIEEMIDQKDVLREKEMTDKPITSEDSINFIVEHFDIQPPDLKTAYHRLRLFTITTKEVIEEEIGEKITRKGTDLFLKNRKLNVGIATVSKNSIKMHFGLNINSKGTPPYVQAIGLKEMGIEEEKMKDVALNIAHAYVKEIKDIEEEIQKTRTF